MTRSLIGLSQCVQLHWIIWWHTQNPVSCAGVANVNCFLWFMQSRGLLLWHKLVLFVNVPCSVIQKVFIVEICTRKKSSTNCHRKFRGRFSSIPFTFKWVVYGRVNKYWTRGSLLQKKQEWMWCMLAEETSDDDWTSSEACPWKCLRWLFQEASLSKSSGHAAWNRFVWKYTNLQVNKTS